MNVNNFVYIYKLIQTYVCLVQINDYLEILMDEIFTKIC